MKTLILSLEKPVEHASPVFSKRVRREGLAPRAWNYFSNIYALGFLPAKNAEGNTKQFLLEVAEILLHYIMGICDGENKVLEFHHPHNVMESLKGFSLELSDQPEPLEQILAEYRDALKYGVKTGDRKQSASLFPCKCLLLGGSRSYLQVCLELDDRVGWYCPAELTHMCFWNIPWSGSEWDKLLQIAPKIKPQMTEEGLTIVTYQPQGENANFFRIVFTNSAARKPDVYFLLEETERLT